MAKSGQNDQKMAKMTKNGQNDQKMAKMTKFPCLIKLPSDMAKITKTLLTRKPIGI